jgi:hypothetical protein
MSLPRRQMSLPFAEPSVEPDEFRRLVSALSEPARTEGLLELAERAERAFPGDANVLCAAASAALLEGRPDKATVYLKRYAKRYAAGKAYHLLSALVLAAQKNIFAARTLLERHNLTEWRDAVDWFPGGWGRRRWLVERASRQQAGGQSRPAASPAEKSSAAQACRRAAAPAYSARRGARVAAIGAGARRYSARRRVEPRADAGRRGDWRGE